MSNLDDFWRTEEYHSAKSTGNLGDFGQRVIGNAAFAARVNPIPGILEHLLTNPNRQNLNLCVFTLSGHFIKQGICKSADSVDVANDAVGWWLDPNCHACQGTGVKNKEQETCPVCDGMKEKLPSWEPSRRGVAEIKNLIQWREQQLRKRNSA